MEATDKPENFFRYFAIEKDMNALGMNIDREVELIDFTGGTIKSMKELDNVSYLAFCFHMTSKLYAERVKIKESENKQRRKIIALFCQMGYKIGEKADMPRIHAWCEKSGHLHKNLNYYHGKDLVTLVSQAEQVYNSFLKGLKK